MPTELPLQNLVVLIKALEEHGLTPNDWFFNVSKRCLVLTPPHLPRLFCRLEFIMPNAALYHWHRLHSLAPITDPVVDGIADRSHISARPAVFQLIPPRVVLCDISPSKGKVDVAQTRSQAPCISTVVHMLLDLETPAPQHSGRGGGGKKGRMV